MPVGPRTIGDYATSGRGVDDQGMDYSGKYLRSPISTEIEGGRTCTLLTIGHVALALHRTTWTVRHWQRIGLLPPPFVINPEVPNLRRSLYPAPFINALVAISDRCHVGRRLDRDQWERFRDEVFGAYEITVGPYLEALGVEGVVLQPSGAQR